MEKVCWPKRIISSNLVSFLFLHSHLSSVDRGLWSVDLLALFTHQFDKNFIETG